MVVPSGLALFATPAAWVNKGSRSMTDRPLSQSLVAVARSKTHFALRVSCICQAEKKAGPQLPSHLGKPRWVFARLGHCEPPRGALDSLNPEKSFLRLPRL